MTHRPALHRQTFRTGLALLALLGAGTATAPAAWAVVDQTDPSADQPTTTDAPFTFGLGELLLFVGEEQGNELGGDVDLSGATIRVTFSGPEGDDEDFTCTTDADGACRFVDEEGEFSVGTLPGDSITIEQTTAPSSGVFLLPAGQDAVVHAVVPESTSGIAPERTEPLPATTSPDVVDRMAPDVLTKGNAWNQVVFFDPLATAPDGTEPGTSDPDGTTAGGSIPGDTAPGAEVPNPAVPGAPSSTAGGTTASAPAVTTSGIGAAPVTAAPTTAAPTAAATPASTAANRPLATTGTELAPVLALGSALLAAGTVGLLVARRRTVR